MLQFDTFLKEFNQLESRDLIMNILQFALWTLFVLLLMWIVRKAINKSITDNASRYRARKATRVLSYLFLSVVAIIIFTGKGEYFTVTLGMFAAGMAFALQEVILSLVGWIAIFSSKMYKPGDRIEINGVRGDVIDISLTKTTLMEMGGWVTSENYNGIITKVSNAFIFKGNVRNFTTDFPFVWDEITLPIHYDSDLEMARKIVQDTADDCLLGYARFAKDHWKKMVQNYMIENANVDPTLSIALTDNWIDVNLRYVVDIKKRRATKNELYEKILMAIQRTDGKVKLASATFELVTNPVNISAEIKK